MTSINICLSNNTKTFAYNLTQPKKKKTKSHDEFSRHFHEQFPDPGSLILLLKFWILWNIESVGH